jgi:hypothetical protein
VIRCVARSRTANIPDDEQAVPVFLERVVQQQPYWSA